MVGIAMLRFEGICKNEGIWMGDVGAGISSGSLPGLGKDAAVLTHQNTVRKCRRLCQGPEDYHMPCRLLLCVEMLSAVLEKAYFIGMPKFII